jgi:hypothetical protein
LETSATKVTPLKEQAQQTVAGSRVAAAPFKPSTPTPTTRRPIKEVIAFGGINQKLSSPVRSSERVKMQKNGDATQMERAVMMTEQRLYAISPGYQQSYPLDQYLGVPPSRGAAGTYGFWMHTIDGGRSGYLQPGWLAAF